MLFAMVCLCSYAQGEYLFSHTAKYVTIGENQITNTTFTDFTGWQNELGQEVFAQFWEKAEGAGPGGSNAVMALSSDATDGAALVWKTNSLQEGLYAVSFYAKSESAFTSSITAGSANYMDVFTSKTGNIVKSTDGDTPDTQIAQVEIINDQWQQITYPVSVANGDYIIINIAKLPAGTLLAGFTISETLEVFDNRISDRLIAYADKLLAEPTLTNGREDFSAWIENEWKAALADPETKDAKGEMMDYVSAFNDEYLPAFLSANGANLMPTYLQDWSTWGKYNYDKIGTKDNWTFTGGRWGCTGNEDYLEFNAGDGYICSAGIQVSQNALNVGLRTREGKLDNLPYGKYFFSIEVQAVTASNRSNPYGADHSVVIAEPWFFFGSENTVLPDTLNGYYWKTLYAIGEIKEGQEKVIGFHFPVLDHKKGGRYSVRNPKIYLLGESDDDMNFKAQKEAFMVQQYNLNKRIVEYPVELNATDYPWEQDSLATAIADAKPVYEASLAIIDADGNVLNKDEVVEENTQLLLDQVNALGRARNYLIEQNAPITALKEAVAAAKEALAAAQNAGASAEKRSDLQATVAEGEKLLAAITSTNQGEAFTSAVSDILNAKEEFESTSASRANPTDIQIKNADFSDFAANSNITSAGANKDWNWSMAASTSRWEIRDNETLSQGHGASIWRGTTVGLDGKCQQTVELTYEGLYEYRAEAYISEENVNELVAAAEVLDNDTIFKPNIRLFFGEDGLSDSIAISKWYHGVKADGTYFTRDVSGKAYPGMVYATYSIYFKKTGSAPVKAEFGLEAIGNSAKAGANGFGFGSNRIYYVGDEAQYLKDTRSDLDAAVTAAKTLAGNYPDSYWTVKLNRYISDAEAATTAKAMQNALHGINEVSSRLSGTTTAIATVKTTDKTNAKAAKGVYSMAGVKVAENADGLKPGIYIIDGKKVIK